MPPCARADAPPARDHITIDLKRHWQPTVFSASQIKSADNCDLDLSGEFAKFACDQPGARAIFSYDFALPIEMSQYPLFILHYRATNIDTNNTLTCIWIYEGKSKAIFPLIDFDKLTVDGNEHEIQIDLPKAPTGGSGAPFENGPVDGLLVSVMNKDGGEGSIELISAEFRSDTNPQEAQVNDDPIRVHVVSEDDRPINGAQIIVDAERADAARTTTTDANGIATLSPIKNELNLHALSILAAGQTPMDVPLDPSPTDPVEIKLFKAMQVGGFVEDEQGKPLNDAKIRLNFPASTEAELSATHVPLAATVRTNAQGQWLAPPLPWNDQILLRVSHTDYDTMRLTDEQVSIDELRSAISTVKMKK